MVTDSINLGYFHVVNHIIFLFFWDESNLFLSVFNAYLDICINHLRFEERNVDKIFFFDRSFFLKSNQECKRILIDLAQYGDYKIFNGILSKNGLTINEPSHIMNLFIFLQDLKNEQINVHLLFKLIQITLSKMFASSASNNINFHEIFYFFLVIYRKNIVQFLNEKEENLTDFLENHFEFFLTSLTIHERKPEDVNSIKIS